MTVSQAPRSPVPQKVLTELERVVQRWRQLPLDHALSSAGQVRALVQALADRVAVATGVPVSQVPDCGPATLMDQLTVMVYDASTADLSVDAVTSTSTSTSGSLTATLADDLASLRSEIH